MGYVFTKIEKNINANKITRKQDGKKKQTYRAENRSDTCITITISIFVLFNKYRYGYRY